MVTKQEALNKVWQHFVVEKAPRSFDDVSDRCLYRGRNGAMCAFAVVCPVELRDQLTENRSAHAIMVENPELASHFEDPLSSFWDSLQAAHDCYYWDIALELRRIANRWGLTLPQGV